MQAKMARTLVLMKETYYISNFYRNKELTELAYW